MLVPGFAVRELPVSLSNINNLRYRPDGTLVALAYNGNVHLLRDTDGDGLEDRAVLFWDNQGRIQAPIGMALTAPGDARGKGVYVASKGKCSLILDTNGDDRADQEIIVADGWKPLPHGVDALGVALGPDGSVYFGLGAANFTNPYLLDDQGRRPLRPEKRAGGDPSRLARLPHAGDRRHGHPVSRRAVLQRAGRPVRDRSGRGDLAS